MFDVRLVGRLTLAAKLVSAVTVIAYCIDVLRTTERQQGVRCRAICIGQASAIPR
jgi:hypothetical protein